MENIGNMQIVDNKENKFFCFPMISMACKMCIRDRVISLQGSFDSSKGEFRLCGVTADVGGHSYMNYLKVPAKRCV